MSGLMHKVKDALKGGHQDEAAKLEHDGLHGEHGTQSGVHDSGVPGSVAHGDSMSPTNPGVLSSTKHGIHGERDTGTSGTGLSNKELTGQTGTTGESGSVAHGSSISPTNPGVLHSTKPGIHGTRDAGTGGTGLSNSELMQDSGVGSGISSSEYDSPARDTGLGSGHNAGSQYTGTKERDTGLVGSGVGSTGHHGHHGHGTTRDESSLNASSGSGYNPNDRSSTGLGGNDTLTGSGSNTRDTGITGGTGSGHGREEGLIAGGVAGGVGSGLLGKHSNKGDYDSNTRGTGLTGGDSGVGSGYDSNTRTGTSGTGSGLTGTGSGYDSNTRDTGLTGASTGSGLTSSGSGLTGGKHSGLTGGDSSLDSGTTGSHTHHTGGKHSGLTGGDSGLGSDYDSNTRGTGLTGGTSGTGSGLTGSGSGYDSNTRDTGLTGGTTSGTRSGLTGGDSGLGSGTTGSSEHTGLTGKAEQYLEGSEKHHRGDGHPEDIVHPGPHVTQTAKALDPHLN